MTERMEKAWLEFEADTYGGKIPDENARHQLKLAYFAGGAMLVDFQIEMSKLALPEYVKRQEGAALVTEIREFFQSLRTPMQGTA